MRPFLHLSPTVITDVPLLRWVQMLLQMDLYYAWVQMLLPMGPLLHLGLNQNIDIWPESLFARKSGFTRIYSVQIWCAQTKGKLKAKTVNTVFACQFAWGCKFEGKCGIYHLCPLFNLCLNFFAPNLHWVNLVWIKFFVQCLGLSFQNLIYRTLAIKEKRPTLNTQTDSILAKLFT